MRCSKCGADNREGARFCDKCGAKFSPRCPSCGAENRTDAKFCDSCGTAFGADPAVASPAATANDSPIRVTETSAAENLEGERKTVTALFADIKGSMDLIEDLDPEEARAIVDPALKVMIDAVDHYGGYVAQSTGDGIFALFGAPVSYEDHPQRALLAGLRMQVEIVRYAEKLRAEKGVNLQVRMGANTGEVVVREIRTGKKHTEYTPIGHSISVAARLQALATPGSIAIGEPVRKLLEGYFALKPLGPARIKGVSEPVNVYEVTGLGPLRTRLQRAVGRGLTRFVGREHEMEAMRHAAELARGGHGQIVAAVAEAGTGKSRLLFEFKVKHQSDWMVLEAFSVSHGKSSAYLPVIDLLHGYFRIIADDDARTRREKVAGKIAILDRALEDTLPYLFGLLGIVEGEDVLAGMDAEVRKRRTLEAIKSVLLRESLKQPLMVIFEDLHWIDDETQGLLNLLADSIATSRILLLVNYRPEYSHQWGSKTFYTQLRLDPLASESAEEMLNALVGDGLKVRPLKRLIIERTQGNPFFMEETVQVLLDEGALVRDGLGTRLTRPLGELKIPPTVQAILAARIDRLPANEKDLLQTLAVIGNEFQLSLAREVTGKTSDEMNSMLSELQLAEFIYEQPTVGDVEYTFKHALTHDVAYNSLLGARRKLLHERVGQSIETRFAQSIEDHVSELAHHYSRSANKRKAVEFLGQAGRQAGERSAYAEARDHISSALRLVKELPDDLERARIELDLEAAMTPLVHIMTGTTASPEVEQSCLRVRRLAEQVGEQSRLFDAIFGLRLCYMVRGELARAKACAQELLALAARVGGGEYLLSAHFGMAQTLLASGEFTDAAQHCRDALAVARASSERRWHLLADVDVVTNFVLAECLCCLGFPHQAGQIERDALREGLDATKSYTRLLAMAFDAELQQTLRDGRRTLEQTDAAISYASEIGAVSQLPRMAPVRGWALIKTGQVEEGISMLHMAITGAEAAGIGLVVQAQCALAEAYQASGKAHEGLEVLRRAQELMERTGERHWAADLFRLKGELTLQSTPNATGEAEAAFHEAIEIARSQNAKLYELRTTTSLARMLRDTSRRDEARAMLADIYNWFTEGFDTADLKVAKALLEELST
jgi:class 3 adenylate cyclase/tetratricopeptide (TPR) repeat protein